ncbi:polyamine ABC transporter substrate-binding protein [Pseudomonas putida]|uniref:Putrescine-binding periplasmic protein n=1 Tax=Pseudomonas putida TaxID=303 RepID=A0A1Q9R8A5_PSEPU|nr:polyamine ABC transporter substrate-binding protein [Pseudomonas putida]OLS63664.1 Putrescine-binding periplasmic protein precursor [Pseudomonas putida]
MKPYKFMKLGLALLLPVTMGVAAEAAKPSVHLYNWYDFIHPDTPRKFEQETGVGVLLDSFDSSEVMQSKVMVGKTGYDVVVATDYTLPNMIKAGALKALDRNQLGNWSHMDPALMKKMEVNDPGNRYAVPYLVGTTGIGYNAELVKKALGPDAPVNSWDLIFKEENIARLAQCGVAVLDSPSEIIPIALHYLDLPPESENADDYKKAQALLLKIRPHIRYFDSSKFVTDLSNGDICVAISWSGGVHDAQVAIEHAGSDRKVEYSIPKEGAPIWMESLVMLSDAPHPDQGLAFINYMMKPEVIASSSNFLGYPNANLDARPLLDLKLRESQTAYPSAQVMETLFPLHPLPLKIERIRTRVWSAIKTGV